MEFDQRDQHRRRQRAHVAEDAAQPRGHDQDDRDHQRQEQAVAELERARLGFLRQCGGVGLAPQSDRRRKRENRARSHQRPRARTQQLRRGRRDDADQQQHRSQVGQQRRRGRAGRDFARFPRALAKARDRRGGGGKPREKAGYRQAPAGADRTQRDVAQHAHRHHQHDQLPEIRRHQDAPRIDRLVRQQRQHHERRRSQQQGVLHLAFADDVARETPQGMLGEQQHRADHSETRGDRRIDARKGRQRRGDEQGHFAGQPGVVGARAQVCGHREHADGQHHGDQHRGADGRRRARRRGNHRVRADPGDDRAIFAVMAFAHYADE
jgi:hypothetical protein